MCSTAQGAEQGDASTGPAECIKYKSQPAKQICTIHCKQDRAPCCVTPEPMCFQHGHASHAHAVRHHAEQETDGGCGSRQRLPSTPPLHCHYGVDCCLCDKARSSHHSSTPHHTSTHTHQRPARLQHHPSPHATGPRPLWQHPRMLRPGPVQPALHSGFNTFIS